MEADAEPHDGRCGDAGRHRVPVGRASTDRVASRALGWSGVSARAGGRGHSAHRAHPQHRRRVRRADLGPQLQGGAVARRRHGDSAQGQRHRLRPAGVRVVRGDRRRLALADRAPDRAGGHATARAAGRADSNAHGGREPAGGRAGRDVRRRPPRRPHGDPVASCPARDRGAHARGTSHHGATGGAADDRHRPFQGRQRRVWASARRRGAARRRRSDAPKLASVGLSGPLRRRRVRGAAPRHTPRRRLRRRRTDPRRRASVPVHGCRWGGAPAHRHALHRCRGCPSPWRHVRIAVRRRRQRPLRREARWPECRDGSAASGRTTPGDAARLFHRAHRGAPTPTATRLRSLRRGGAGRGGVRRGRRRQVRAAAATQPRHRRARRCHVTGAVYRGRWRCSLRTVGGHPAHRPPRRPRAAATVARTHAPRAGAGHRTDGPRAPDGSGDRRGRRDERPETRAARGDQALPADRLDVGRDRGDPRRHAVGRQRLLGRARVPAVAH